MTITLYPAIVYDNNLSLDHGGSEVDEACEQIYNATKGWGVSGIFLASGFLLLLLLLLSLLVYPSETLFTNHHSMFFVNIFFPIGYIYTRYLKQT